MNAFKTFLNKVGSRKFCMALVDVVTGILLLANFNDNVVTSIGSIVMIMSGTIAYMIMEGRVDVARMLQATKEVIDIAENLEEQSTEVVPSTEDIEN